MIGRSARTFLLRVARARAQTGGHQGGGGPFENEEGANSNNSDSEQHLDNLRRKGLLPRLKNDRSICLLGWLFGLELCRCC
jgi:hypothetical protein